MGKSENALVTKVMSEIKIDKDDLIAIRVSEVETGLLQAQAETDTEIRKADKANKDADKALTKAVEKRMETKYGSDADKAMKALKTLGVTNVAKILNVSRDDEGNRAKVSVGVKTVSGYGGSLTADHKVSYDADEKSQVKAIEKRNEHLRSLRERAVEIRKRLSQLSSLERQAKAAMAKNALKQSREGRELLDQVSRIPGLPELPNLKGLK